MAITTDGHRSDCVRSFPQPLKSDTYVAAIIEDTPETKFVVEIIKDKVILYFRIFEKNGDFLASRIQNTGPMRHTFNRNTKQTCTALEKVATIRHMRIL